MRPPARRIARALAAALFVGGCFDFDATTAGGPLVDAGPSKPDASVTDGSSPVDGGANAPDGGPYCASLPASSGVLFCDDFDDPTTLPRSWNYYDQLSGTLIETTASARSGPNSVDLTTNPLTYGQVIDVALRTPLAIPTPPATLRFAFSLQPVHIDTTANAAIVLGAVDFFNAVGGRYSLGLAINVVSGKPALALGEQSGLIDGGSLPDGSPPPFVNHPLDPTKPLPMSEWSDLVIELVWTTTTLQGRVTVNAQRELDVPLTMTLHPPTSLQIGIGTSYVTEYTTGTSPVWELRYDNVSFSAK